MKLRRTYITEDETITTSGTEKYNLDFTNPIQEIQISFYGEREDHTDTNAPYLLSDIDKIEIVDGSDVIYSCSGEQAAATQLYHTGMKPFEALTLNKFSTNRSSLRILFGRSKFDTEYALDCRKFTNPQLKITHSFTEGSTGNWASDAQKVTISVLTSEAGGTPRGFFMTKEIYDWTKASSGDETIDMPRDYPYRFIVIKANSADTPIYAEFSNVKISCNYDEFVPINETTEDMAWRNVQHYGMLLQQTESIGDGSDADIKAYYPFAWNWGAWPQSWNFGDGCVVKRPYSGYITVAQDSSTALVANQRAIITGYGWEYYDTEVIKFGDIEKESHWFNPKEYKSVRLILTQAQTADLESSVVLQQVRNY